MLQSVMQVTGERTVKVDFPTPPFWLQIEMLADSIIFGYLEVLIVLQKG